MHMGWHRASWNEYRLTRAQPRRFVSLCGNAAPEKPRSGGLLPQLLLGTEPVLLRTSMLVPALRPVLVRQPLNLFTRRHRRLARRHGRHRSHFGLCFLHGSLARFRGCLSLFHCLSLLHFICHLNSPRLDWPPTYGASALVYKHSSIRETQISKKYHVTQRMSQFRLLESLTTNHCLFLRYVPDHRSCHAR